MVGSAIAVFVVWNEKARRHLSVEQVQWLSLGGEGSRACATRTTCNSRKREFATGRSEFDGHAPAVTCVVCLAFLRERIARLTRLLPCEDS